MFVIKLIILLIPAIIGGILISALITHGMTCAALLDHIYVILLIILMYGFYATDVLFPS